MVQAEEAGLNFAAAPPELFAGKETGEDAFRVLNDIIPLQTAIRADVAAELPHLRQTVNWAARLSWPPPSDFSFQVSAFQLFRPAPCRSSRPIA